MKRFTIEDPEAARRRLRRDGRIILGFVVVALLFVGMWCGGVFSPLCDADGDGYKAVGYGGEDCDDMNPAVYPGAVEEENGVGDDCDGEVDEFARSQGVGGVYAWGSGEAWF